MDNPIPLALIVVKLLHGIMKVHVVMNSMLSSFPCIGKNMGVLAAPSQSENEKHQTPCLNSRGIPQLSSTTSI